MPTPGLLLGRRVGPFAGRLDEQFLRLFAIATKDRSPSVLSGSSVPPVAVVTQIWEAQNSARDTLVPIGLQQAATSGVHGEHDIVVHRPIEVGEPLRTWVEGHGARPGGRNALVTLRYTTLDARDAIVCEQWWTTVFLGTGCDVVGLPTPDHTFPDPARRSPVGTASVRVDGGMARQYAELSGDWSAHHFDATAARRSGFERPFLHGLCTMALCGQLITHLIAADDPVRVARVAVRFATPLFLEEQLDLALYDAGPLGHAFEASSGGAVVISHGRAELRPR